MSRMKVARVVLMLMAAGVSHQVLGDVWPAGASEQASGSTRPSGQAGGVPKFELDPTFPQQLPNNWVLGTSINVSIDRRDHVWIIHRFRLVPVEQKERAAPPVIEFDEKGKFYGRGAAHQTPTNGPISSMGSPWTTRTTSGSRAVTPFLRRARADRMTWSSSSRPTESS
jgi:hypothetical protein